jgi:hypothetical protein
VLGYLNAAGLCELAEQFPDQVGEMGWVPPRPANPAPDTAAPPLAEARPAPDPPVRIVSGVQCVLETHSVWLNGKRIAENVDPTAFRLFQKIADARGDIVRGEVLRTLPGLAGAKLSRVLKRMPKAVRDLIRSKPAGNGGYWLQLPAPKTRP